MTDEGKRPDEVDAEIEALRVERARTIESLRIERAEGLTRPDGIDEDIKSERVTRAERVEGDRVVRAEHVESDRVLRAEHVEEQRVAQHDKDKTERYEERAHEYAHRTRRAVPLIVVLGIVIAVLSGISFYNSQRIANNQAAIKRADAAALKDLRKSDAEAHSQLASIRQLDYRLCVRVNDTRGVIIITTAAAKVSKRPLKADLPLYNCVSTIQDGVNLMTPKQENAYLRLLEHGKKRGP